ncbi:MAG: ABC transporter permease [Bacteroidales bacterium]|jgi:putative ABC transport system permease protein|nr:ABC transporter permease [Bacteroidales bacterium]MDG1902454.1 ABC transporter permease [Bacteroidales bacterium]MDG2081924.1 ABC transporter permease [Bacteroidales bacterium]|tara:strand:- start:17574 stop:18815 length:1242 start_codon:yes stop_codon:yes gene_type:complete
MKVLKLISESILFASNALAINKIRSVLSLLGITIGIFSIISVFTVFDSLENAIKSEINSLGSNVIFIQKWPWAVGSEYPWWKYYQRPEPKLKEMGEIMKRSNTVDASAFMVTVNRDVYYGADKVENVPVVSVSQDYTKVMPFDLQEGRYFTPAESYSGRNIAIIGADIAEGLFKGRDAIGKQIKVFGRKTDVIGVTKKQGEDVFGNSKDNWIIIPAKYGQKLLDFRRTGTTIIVKARPDVSNDQMIDELAGIMRSIRKLPPSADDSFALNETDIINKGFDQLFAVIATVGWIIGGFSLLVGGFGVANIMFVSVKERTNQIGIQKALGAKNYFILLQFLFEAVFLAIIGGILGLLIVYALTFMIGSIFNFELILTLGNITLGILVSAMIGFVSGFIPAWSASRLDPVEAMRSSF